MGRPRLPSAVRSLRGPLPGTRVSVRLPGYGHGYGFTFRFFLCLFLLVVAFGSGEELVPADDVLTAPEQGTPFTFGHSPPDTELDAVVERLRQAQCPDRTASADQFGSVLCRTLHEQGIRIDFSAFGAYRHLFIPHVAPLPRSACVVFVTPPPGMSGDGRGTVAAPRTLVTGPDGGPHGTSSGFFRLAAFLVVAGVETTVRPSSPTVPKRPISRMAQ